MRNAGHDVDVTVIANGCRLRLLAGLSQGRPSKTRTSAGIPTQAEAAALLNVSERSVAPAGAKQLAADDGDRISVRTRPDDDVYAGTWRNGAIELVGVDYAAFDFVDSIVVKRVQP